MQILYMRRYIHLENKNNTSVLTVIKHTHTFARAPQIAHTKLLLLYTLIQKKTSPYINTFF